MKYFVAFVVVGLMALSVGTCVHDFATGDMVKKVEKAREVKARKCAERDFVSYREWSIACH